MTAQQIATLHKADADAMWAKHGMGWYRASAPYGCEQDAWQWVEILTNPCGVSRLDDYAVSLYDIAEWGALNDARWYDQYCDCGTWMLEWGGDEINPDEDAAKRAELCVC